MLDMIGTEQIKVHIPIKIEYQIKIEYMFSCDIIILFPERSIIKEDNNCTPIDIINANLIMYFKMVMYFSIFSPLKLLIWRNLFI